MGTAEVLFIAIPLWIVVIGGLFALVFGWDILGYVKSNSAPRVARPPNPLPTVAGEKPVPYEEPVSKGERELVLR